MGKTRFWTIRGITGKIFFLNGVSYLADMSDRWFMTQRTILERLGPTFFEKKNDIFFGEKVVHNLQPL